MQESQVIEGKVSGSAVEILAGSIRGVHNKTAAKRETSQIGARISHIVRRLKKVGLSGPDLEKAMLAVSGGEIFSSQKLKLSAAVRKSILAYVRQNGPIVFTGKTHLKMYTVDTFKALQKSSSATASKRHAKGGK